MIPPLSSTFHRFRHVFPDAIHDAFRRGKEGPAQRIHEISGDRRSDVLFGLLAAAMIVWGPALPPRHGRGSAGRGPKRDRA